MRFIYTRFGFVNMNVLYIRKDHRFETVIVDV